MIYNQPTGYDILKSQRMKWDLFRCSMGLCRRGWCIDTDKNLSFLLNVKISFYSWRVDDILMENDRLLTSLAMLLCPPLTHQMGEFRAFVPLIDLSETLEPEGAYLLPCSVLHKIHVGNNEQPVVFHRCPPLHKPLNN